MLRNKPRYNSQRLTYVDKNNEEHMFYCDEVTHNKRVAMLLNLPVKDSGSRFITSSDLDFEIDAEIIQGESIKRIMEVPEIKPIKSDNNSRRGRFRKDKVIVTT